MHTLLMSIGFRAIKRITFASDRMTLGVEMALLMAFVLAGSTLYFLAVERPCMDRHWPAELWSRLRGRGHAAAVRS
jgi:hypothetical protein